MVDGGRPGEFAAEFEAAQNDFIKLVSSLTDAEWRMVGQNYPKRTNDEDEGRAVAVIAHHVALSGPLIIGRVNTVVAGSKNPPLDIHQMNAEHARDHANVSRDEVLRILRDSAATIAASLREIPDDKLDLATQTPSGPLTVAFTIQAVLIGHIKMHQGSIETAITR